MTEKQYKYTAEIKQPQTVAGIKLDPKGGSLTEREYKTVKKDKYGASLLEKGFLEVVEDTTPAKATVPSGETVPDFSEPADRPEDHAGWKPE
jgi:hypothetical protein